MYSAHRTYAPEEGAVEETVGMRKMDWKEAMAASASRGESWTGSLLAVIAIVL